MPYDNRNPDCPKLKETQHLPGTDKDSEDMKICMECAYGTYSNGTFYCTLQSPNT